MWVNIHLSHNQNLGKSRFVRDDRSHKSLRPPSYILEAWFSADPWCFWLRRFCLWRWPGRSTKPFIRRASDRVRFGMSATNMWTPAPAFLIFFAAGLGVESASLWAHVSFFPLTVGVNRPALGFRIRQPSKVESQLMRHYPDLVTPETQPGLSQTPNMKTT